MLWLNCCKNPIKHWILIQPILFTWKTSQNAEVRPLEVQTLQITRLVRTKDISFHILHMWVCVYVHKLPYFSDCFSVPTVKKDRLFPGGSAFIIIMAGLQFWNQNVLLPHFLGSSGDNGSSLSPKCWSVQRQDLAANHSLLAPERKDGQDRFTISRAKPRKQVVINSWNAMI